MMREIVEAVKQAIPGRCSAHRLVMFSSTCWPSFGTKDCG